MKYFKTVLCIYVLSGIGGLYFAIAGCEKEMFICLMILWASAIYVIMKE